MLAAISDIARFKTNETANLGSPYLRPLKIGAEAIFGTYPTGSVLNRNFCGYLFSAKGERFACGHLNCDTIRHVWALVHASILNEPNAATRDDRENVAGHSPKFPFEKKPRRDLPGPPCFIRGSDIIPDASNISGGD
jgi:hypothetical protein